MLDRLTLSHFRSHRVTRLAFDGRPVAIFGPNGAGKTNVLEAVSLLSPGRGLRRAAPEELARRPEQVGWKIVAEAGPTGIETWAAPGQSRRQFLPDALGGPGYDRNLAFAVHHLFLLLNPPGNPRQAC